MADFEFDPVNGWEDENVFPDYPLANEVRPLFQRLFNQLKIAFNTHKNETAYFEAYGISGAQSISDNLATDVIFGVRVVNGGTDKSLAQIVGNQISINNAGVYLLNVVQCSFAANSTGYRRLDANGTSRTVMNAVNGTNTIMTTSIPINISTPGTVIPIKVLQNSGAPLNLSACAVNILKL